MATSLKIKQSSCGNFDGFEASIPAQPHAIQSTYACTKVIEKSIANFWVKICVHFLKTICNSYRVHFILAKHWTC